MMSLSFVFVWGFGLVNNLGLFDGVKELELFFVDRHRSNELVDVVGVSNLRFTLVRLWVGPDYGTKLEQTPNSAVADRS